MIHCPHCQGRLTFVDRLAIRAGSQSPCRYCDQRYTATNTSFSIWLIVWLGSSFLFLKFFSAFIDKPIFIGLFMIFWFATYPVFLRVKPYKKKEIWLPKSRIIGYLVYLLLPVIVFFSLLLLAAHFKIGV